MLERLLLALALTGAPAGAASTVDRAVVAAGCPASAREWATARDRIKDARSVSELLAFGQRVITCRATERHPEVAACLSPLAVFAALAIEQPIQTNPLLTLIPKELPKELYYFPAEFQDLEFWRRFAWGSPEESDAAVAALATRIPGSVTLRYRSELQPRTDLYLTVYQPDPATTRMVHYDKDLVVNVLTLHQETPGAKPKALLAYKDLNEPDFRSRMETADGRCYRCHQEAALAIVPRSPETTRIRWFNAKYAQLAPTGAADLYRDLPALGSHERSPADPFYARCFGTEDRSLLERYQGAMRCDTCHDGSAMPRLAFPLGNAAVKDERSGRESVTLAHTLHEDLGVPGAVYAPAALPYLFLANGHMPVDFKSTFTRSQRRQLFDCLMTDYLGGMYERAPAALKGEQGVLKKALLAVPCASH